MNWVGVITALGVVASAAGIASWLGFSIDGRRVVAQVIEWLQRSRKEQEALKKRIGELEEQIHKSRDLIEEVRRWVSQELDRQSEAADSVHELDLREWGHETETLRRRIESSEQMLIEAREQIGDLRRVDANQEERITNLETSPLDRLIESQTPPTPTTDTSARSAWAAPLIPRDKTF